MIRRTTVTLLVAATLAVWFEPSFRAAAPIIYRISIPEPEHHWMQVEMTVPEIGNQALELRMSRSSPGRYSLHEFAKNVYDVHVTGADGRDLTTDRSDESGWVVPMHADTVTVRYKVYGDRLDGTYLAVDSTHAHINMPAAIMWVRGMDDRPVTLTLQPPAGVNWQVATQLHTGGTAFSFTAPNLQYLMDSPLEFGPILVQQFNIGLLNFRFAVHQTGTAAEVAGFAKDVERIVRQEAAIFDDSPLYEPGYYTFLADYLPKAVPDGMEHRNSTVMTYPGSIASSREQLLDTVAHEFFHSWNVERIRPKDLEPFDFDRINLSSSLWLAEGFTQYYGPLALQRAGLINVRATAAILTDVVDTVTTSPGRGLRSAVEMSQMAGFVDGGQPGDRTNWQVSYTSYYPFGAAIALALDLSLRTRGAGMTSLDDFMRVMWRRYGRPGGTREGYVDHPYTLADAEDALAETSDRAFAHDFFQRYIEGRDIADYVRLLEPAGFVVRTLNPGRAWLGDIRLGGQSGSSLAGPLARAWPLYAAGIDQDDELQQLDGTRIGSMNDVNLVLRRHRPGDRIMVGFVDRTGRSRTGSITLGEDPHVEVVPAETIGLNLTPMQRAFRDRWLAPKVG